MTQQPTAYTAGPPIPKQILADNSLTAQLSAKMFDMAYAQLTFPSGSENDYVQPGLIVALNSVTNKYVPWDTGAANGAGSDTAVGILLEQIDVSYWDKMVSPLYHGSVVEQNIYAAATALGTVDSTVKTDLPDIYWRA